MELEVGGLSLVANQGIAGRVRPETACLEAQEQEDLIVIRHTPEPVPFGSLLTTLGEFFPMLPREWLSERAQEVVFRHKGVSLEAGEGLATFLVAKRVQLEVCPSEGELLIRCQVHKEGIGELLCTWGRMLPRL